MADLRRAVEGTLLYPVRRAEDGSWKGLFRFPSDFPGFSGHFPGNPILPAVIQLLSVLAVIEEAYGQRARLLSLDKAKFQERIFPDQEIEVRCRVQEDRQRWTVEATLTVDDQRAATLRLTVALISKR